MSEAQPTPSSEPSPEVLDEFRKLFQAAHREHRRNGKNATTISPAHSAAVEYAKEHDIPGATNLLDAIVLTNQQRGDEALPLVDRAVEEVPEGLRGQAHHTRGRVFFIFKRYDEAIREYEQALGNPCYDTPGNALNSLGVAYTGLKQYERAIEFYEKALATPGYDTPGNVLHNLGITYDDLKQYDRAIEFYEKALATPGYDTPHLTRCNMANSLRLAGRLQEALQQVESVLGEPDHEGQHERAKYLKQLILADLAKIPISPADDALAASATDPDTPEARMRDKLQRLEDQYEAYLKKEASNRNDTLSALRGWSSAVTLLEGSRDGHWRGGGYFLKWQERGIVIDPGFDFLDNFHDAGFHAREVDAVLVSHSHSDHNFDLRGLDDLRYEIYRRSIETHPDGSRHPALGKSVFVIDEDTAKAFGDDNPPHRGTALKFSKGDFQIRRWLEPGNLNLPATIEHFPVEHGEDVPHAVGIRLRLHRDGQPDFVIGYTGDTRLFDGLADHLQDCDLLIAHISQPDPQEFNDDSARKKVHLGYNGVAELIKATTPKLTVVGEFWAGLADLRVDLIHGLRRRTNSKAILPMGLGFHLSLPSLEVECTECRKPTPFGQIRIAPPTSPFGPLGYLCQRCLI